MSSSSNSPSSLTGSTSNPPDGSGRTFNPYSFQFGTVPPVFNPDGSIKGIYDVERNFYVSNSDATRRSRISGLGGSPTLVNASSPRGPPSSMGNVAGGGSMSSGGGIPTTRFGSNEQNLMMSGVQGSPQFFPVLGSPYPTAGGHSPNQVQAMNSISFMNDMNSNYTPPFQLGPQMNQGLGLSPMYQLNQESIIQNEDFPALPGYAGSNADYQMDLHHQEAMMQSQQSSMGSHGGFYFGGASTSHYPQQLQHAQAVSSYGISSQTGGSPSIQSIPVNPAMGYGQPFQHHQNTSQFRGQELPAIGQHIRDVGSKPVQETTQSNPDPYRMLRLVSVIKNTKPDLTTLALGMDLTAMGLDMTSKESLFKTFASPWANEPLKDDPHEFTVPQCYNAMQLQPPQQELFRSFKLVTLFFIFHSMPKDEAQLYAADELYNRGWLYLKDHKCWFIPIGEPLVKTDTYERGTYYFFDPEKFECVQKENIFIHYEKLEKRPSLPQQRV